MAAGVVEDAADEGKELVRGAGGYCFEHALCAFLGKEPSENVGAFDEKEVDVELGGGKLLLNGGEIGVQVLVGGGPDEKKRTLGTREGGSGD